MKKILALLLAAFMLVLFSGCITVPVETQKVLAKPEEITSMEVYYFPDAVYFDDNVWTTQSISTDENGEYIDIYIPYETEAIASVNEEDYASFIADYEALPYTYTFILAAVDPARYFIGYVVKINLNCGEDFRFLRNTAGGSMDYCEEEIWENFLKKYIGEEPFQTTQE